MLRFEPDANASYDRSARTIALIKDSDGGRLVSSQGEWSFIPEAGFSGRVTIPFTVFDGLASDVGWISIDVLQP